MRKTIILFVLMFSAYVAFSQKTLENSFKIKENRSSIPEAKINASILKANFETYRDREKDVTLSFSNGFEITLLSAKTLFLKGLQINVTTYDNKPESALVVNCTLLDSGYIIIPVSTSKDTKYKSTKQ